MNENDTECRRRVWTHMHEILIISMHTFLYYVNTTCGIRVKYLIENLTNVDP